MPVAQQDEERGLEGVFDVRVVRQHLATRGHDPRPVTADQSFKSGRVAGFSEPAEQVGIGSGRAVEGERRAETLDGTRKGLCITRHGQPRSRDDCPR